MWIYIILYVSSKSISSVDGLAQVDDIAGETDRDECSLSSGEPVKQEGPLGSVNGKSETDDKENNNGISTDETQAVRYDCRKEHCYETPKKLQSHVHSKNK